MTPALVSGIFDLMLGLSYCVTIVCGIFIGYWMGRNSADQPFRSDYNQPKKDKGSTEEPEHGDSIADAMKDEKKEKGIPTVMDRRI